MDTRALEEMVRFYRAALHDIANRRRTAATVDTLRELAQSALLRDVPEHHVWCSMHGLCSPENCEQCKELWVRFPFGKESEIAALEGSKSK